MILDSLSVAANGTASREAQGKGSPSSGHGDRSPGSSGEARPDADHLEAAPSSGATRVTARDSAASPFPTIELVTGLSSREKARRLLAASRTTEIGQRTLAFYLNEMHVSGDCKDFGCATARQFAMEKLELPRSTATRLQKTGAELTRLGKVDTAFCRGDLRWSKVCLLCEVAVPETEEQWLAFARKVTVRQLQREVSSTEKGRLPRGNRRGLPRLSYVIEGRTDEIGHEVWETARQKLADDIGEAVSNAELMQTLAEAFLRNGLCLMAPRLTPLREDEAEGGADDGALDGAAEKESRKRLRDSLFCLVVDECPGCKETVLHKEDGPVVLSAAKAEMIAEEARVHRAVFDGSAANAASRGAASREAASRGAAARVADGIDDPTPAWMRRYVLLRDGNRCRCCRRRYLLMAHHVIFRRQGGETHPRNLASLCGTCHEMVHEGKLTVEGNADTGFRFKGPDGEPVGKPLRDPATTRVVISGPAGNEIPAVEALASANARSEVSKVDQAIGSSPAEALSTAESAPKGDVVSLGLTSDRRRTQGAREGITFETLPPSIGAAEWRKTLEWRGDGRCAERREL